MTARLLALLCLITSGALAHHDVEGTVKALSAKIAKAPTADLYHDRAVEYRALRKPEKAITDLREALKIKPSHRSATVALIPLLLESGKNDEALQRANAHLKTVSRGPAQLEAYFLAARVFEALGEYHHARVFSLAIDRIYPEHDASVDLFHARMLRKIGAHPEAADVLKDAWKRTGSVVLRNQWIDAALTVGKTSEALPIIEKELADSRFRSSWLIRRARAHRHLKQLEQANTDLQAALNELTPRINKDRPDLTLISDRGFANLLMGNLKKAQEDLVFLKKSSLPADAYHLLEAGVEAAK